MGPSTEESASLARSVAAVEGGFVACLQTSDAGRGGGIARIVRCEPGGRPAQTLFEGKIPPGGNVAETEIFSCFPDRSAGLVALNTSTGAKVRALDTELAGAAAMVSEMSAGIVPTLAAGAGFVAALDQSHDARGAVAQRIICVDTTGTDPQGRYIDTRALALTERRQIACLVGHSGALYAAVADATAGFDLFRIRPNAPDAAPEPVIVRGGHRFALNAAVSAAHAVAEGLLIGTAALAGGDLQIGNWGPELILLMPEGGWDLVIGQPRFSPDGLKLPASGLTPGIDTPGNAAVKAIASGERGGVRMVYIAIQEFLGEHREDRRSVAPDFFEYQGEVRIFASPDLVNWNEIAADLPADAGAVTGLCVTDAGLVVAHEGLSATAPPFTIVATP